MFAVGLKKGVKGIQSFDIGQPKIRKPSQVLVRVKEVGVDGTDFGMVKHDQKDIAKGRKTLVLGHELSGIIEKTGNKVKGLHVGDPVTMTVRRGCGMCHPCLHDRSDYCMTGLYTERGIHKVDGFLTERTVDDQKYLLKLPKNVANYGFMVEPLSVAEKGLELIKLIQSRMPWACAHPHHDFDNESWGDCRTALVIGAGPLGFLATCLLRLANVNTYVLERKPPGHRKVKLIKELGAKYIDLRGKTPKQIVEEIPKQEVNMIFEASGASKIAIKLIPYMSRSSIYVMTGIPRGEMKAVIDSNLMLRQIVRYNQVVVGSVNSSIQNFRDAITHLPLINKRWDNIIDRAITHRFDLRDYEKAFSVPRSEESVKIVAKVS